MSKKMADVQTKKAGAKGQAATAEPSFTTILPRDLSIDFVGKRRFFMILSTVLNILAIGLFFTWGFNYGVDFTGGTSIWVRIPGGSTAGEVRTDLEGLNLQGLTVQDFGAKGSEFLLRFEIEEGEQMSSISDQLSTSLGEDGRAIEILSVDSVGPKVAGDLWWRGFWAVAFATSFMGIYITFRFERSFGLGAVIALIHDVFITTGALMLAQLTFDLTTLAALLTVIGFSVHDTIIVSDRVRENIRRNPRLDLATVINQSINETLSRTILTTGTALFVLFALYFLGGKGLEPFAFTLLIGFITGTYSSIYIAAPVVLFWADRSRLAS